MYTEELIRPMMPDSEKLTETEVGAVIGLWVERQNAAPQATVADVAEGLEIPIEEAKALLAEVRAAKADRLYQISQEQGRLSQELSALAAERNALARAEWTLTSVRTQRKQVYQARVERQARRPGQSAPVV
jgi:hypothetical protein